MDEPFLAFYFGNVKNDESNEAEVMLGGVNDNHYSGKLFKLPLRRNGTWEVDIDAINLGNETIRLGGAGVSIDIGTSLISLPSTLAAVL